MPHPEPVLMTHTDEQRAKFEAWVKLHVPGHKCIRDEVGYEFHDTQLLWLAWNAALAAQEGGAVQWACERWRAEVANRPLVNTHRRALDTTWRQVVRHFGGDDVALLGPCHDDLVSAQEGTGNG